MNVEEKRKDQLVKELADMRQRMGELNRSATQSKLAEEELVKSEERYRNLVELSPDMIALHSRGKYVYVNPAGIKMLGASGPEDLIGKPTFETIHPDYIEIVKERTRQLMQGKAVPLVEEKYVRLDGKIVDVEVAAAPIPFQGEPMVQVIAREITERKRMEAALRSSEKAAQRLAQANAIIAEIGRIISSTLNINEVYDHFAEAVRKLIPFDRISINVVNLQDGSFFIPYVAGLNVTRRKKGDVIPLAGTAAEEVLRTRSSLLLGNLEEFVSWFPGLLPLWEAGFQSMMVVPLTSQGRVIGILNLQLSKPPLYTEQELKLAENVGIQIAGAIANAQLYKERMQAEEILGKSEEEAKRLSQENAVMAEIGRIISSTLKIEEVYDRFAEEVSKLIPLDRICISVLEPEAGIMENAYVSGVEVPDRKAGNSYRLQGSVGEKIMHARKSLLVQTDDQDEIRRYFPNLLTTFQAGLRSMLSVPLISKDQVIGILHIRSLRPKAYTEKEVKLAEEVGNQIAGAISSARLYSGLREAKETLQKREEEFRELYDHAPLGYHEYDREGKITRVNQTDLEMLGYSAEEMIGQPIWKFNVEEELAREQVPAKLAGKLPPGRNLVRTYRRKDGSTLPVLIEDRLLRDERGEIIGIRCTIQDITERKRAEEAQRKSEEEANRLAQENAIMAEIGRIISSSLNIEEVFALFSEKVKSLLPYDRLAINLINEDGTSLINRYVVGDSAPQRNVGEVQPKTGTLTEMVILNRKGLVINSQGENEIAAKYPGLLPEMKAGLGSFLSVPLVSVDQPIGGLHFRSKGYGVYSEKDLKVAESIAIQIAGAIANAQLFSKHERAENEKASLQQQLYQSQKMEAVGRLAGGIAHDFNNLLTVINSNSQLGLMELKEWDPLKEKLDSIQKAGERAANLTRQLLAFSRRQMVEMKVIDLNALLQDLGKMLLRVIGEDIKLKIVPGNNLGRVKADPGQIEQAILNLVVNARDAMPSGGKLTIETANMELDQEYSNTHLGVKPGRYVVLSVNDTGVGMVPEVREHIFEPFFTTKEKGKGTGLGLSTVYGVVKQSGGNIWVYSEPGHGTTFKVYLPQVDEPLEEARKKVGREKLPGGSETILVVEDEEEVRKLAVAILKKQGYRILEAAHGGDAFLICEQGKDRIHLLLTDIVMPEMNGPELARRLRYFDPEMRVLFMSGYTDGAILQHGMLEKEMFFLQKPFSVEGLVGKVREVLDN
jgi:PAS domain S-box-containing protein